MTNPLFSFIHVTDTHLSDSVEILFPHTSRSPPQYAELRSAYYLYRSVGNKQESCLT